MDDADHSPTEDLNILSQESYNRLLRDLPATEQWCTILEGDQDAGFQGTTVEYNRFLVNEDLQAIGSPNLYTHVRVPTPSEEPPEPECPPSSVLVITEPFEGNYGFFLSCGEQEKRTKSTNWTYASSRRKLFVNVNVVCPFHVHVNRVPPPGCILRAMAVYAQSNHAKEVVKCCPIHAAKPSDEDYHTSGAHLVRCESPTATYVEDPVSRRHSVVSPFLKAEVGMAYSVYLYRFVCLSSCAGGPNRRPIKLVFTLEHGREILGRFSMDVKICACPGRDRATEDKQLALRATNDATNGVKRSALEANFVSVVPTKKPKASEEEGYVVKCTDEETFHLLNALNGWTKAIKQNAKPSSAKQSTQSLPLLTLLLNASAQGQCVISSPCDISSPVNERGSQLPTSNESPELAVNFEDAVQVKNDVDAEMECTKSTSIQSWLASLGMSSICQELREKGFTTLGSLETMTWKEAANLKLTTEEKTKLFNSFLKVNLNESEEEELVSLSEREEIIPASQESAPGGFSQQSYASSSGSARSFTVTHVRIKTRIKEDHNYNCS